MNDSTLPDLVAAAKPPDPELLAQEEALWTGLLADFENEQLHNDYLGFVIKNNLLVQGSRRYGDFSKEKDVYAVELRRIANVHQQKIAKILFFVPETSIGGERESSKAEMSAVLIGVIVALFGLGIAFWGPSEFGWLRWVAGFLSIVVIGGGGFYIYRKVQEGTERLNRDG